MNISVNKGRTLDYLAKSMGIAREEVMAFGDARNDVAMLEYAGCSVAVANAVEEAKRAAGNTCALPVTATARRDSYTSTSLPKKAADNQTPSGLYNRRHNGYNT